MKILLVDDNELLWHRLANAIKNVNENITVFKAFDCQEAMSRFSPLNPHLVILDISLPDGSGIDVLRKIKSSNPRVCVCMFTNYGTEEFKKSCRKLGADHFFEKSNLNGLLDSILLQYKNTIKKH